MFCIHCGAEIKNTSVFCTECGKFVAGTLKKHSAQPDIELTEEQKHYLRIQQMSYESIVRISQRDYYCFNCGCYINRNIASRFNGLRCPECGVSIITPYLASLPTVELEKNNWYGATWSVAAGTERINPARFIEKYYYSAFYKQKGVPFDSVATDQENMGKYLVEAGFDWAKNMFPSLRPYIFFDLVVPEGNGSLQEIDAIVVLGTIIYVIETKNRSGIYGMNTMSDKYWTFNRSSGESFKVQSPIIQNNERAVALQSYLNDKLDFDANYFNYVVLSGKGCTSWNVQRDSIDEIILGDYNLDTLYNVTAFFRQHFLNFVNVMKDNDIYDEKYGLKIIDALKPIIEMPEDVKRAKRRDRESDSFNEDKIYYVYYYLELDGTTPLMIRTNKVHTQYRDALNAKWTYTSQIDDDIDKKEMIWKKEKHMALWYRIGTYEELFEISKCVKEGKCYIIPDKLDD